jgi:hypothetical protein
MWRGASELDAAGTTRSSRVTGTVNRWRTPGHYARCERWECLGALPILGSIPNSPGVTPDRLVAMTPQDRAVMISHVCLHPMTTERGHFTQAGSELQVLRSARGQ